MAWVMSMERKIANEWKVEDRTRVHDQSNAMFDHLLLGPARDRHGKNLVGKWPF